MGFQYRGVFAAAAFFLANWGVVPYALAASDSVTAEPDPRPNILWITIEDWSPDLSCYGTPGIHTPTSTNSPQ
ncbi:hypothetical protein, partial [Rhodopirellula sallentina]